MKPALSRSLLSVAALATFGATAPVYAAPTIDFETYDSGVATTNNAQIQASDFDALGVTFTNAFIKQCRGGCPAPAYGHFVSSANFSSPFSINFLNAISAFTFANATGSSGTASAYDSANNLLGQIGFSGFPGAFNLNYAGTSRIEFSSGRQYGVDDFSFVAGGAVPEPASWALMIAGFGLVGGAMRTRRRSVSVRFAA